MLLKDEEIVKNLINIWDILLITLNYMNFSMKRSAKDGMILITDCKFRNHPSIVKIKEQYKVKRNFSFKLATTEDIKTMIWDLPTDKAAGVEIPVTFLLMN